MPAVPDDYRSRTSLQFVIDTNTVDDVSPEMLRLSHLHTTGWINLTRADTMDTELSSAGKEKRDDLLEQSRQYVEHLGPMVLDHSRLDHCVVASSDDENRIRRVFAILLPGADWGTARRNHIRDAMHVSTAIRYAATGFVTNDQGLLKRDAALRAASDNFRVLSAAAALQLTERQVRKSEELAARTSATK